ncbi:MAG: tetratricopeptide repeat protein [Planctomycetota bacterium]|jgi:tetratricopeptide (TPR) repeat protein
MDKFRWMLSIVACLVIAGCIEEKSEFTINPDGSGKIIYEATIQPMSLEMMGEKPDLQVQLKETVRNILTESSGVDAWKDVSCQLTDDGKIYFKGTAYFPDISNLNIHNGFSGFPMTRNEKGEIVIDLETKDMGSGGEKEAEAAPVEFSEAELNERVREAKSGYNQTKMVMAGFLSSLKVESILHLPGTIKEISNFEKIDNRTVRFVLSGAKLLEVMDEIMADEDMLRKQISDGKGPTDYSGDDLVMNEKLFGQKARVRVVLVPDSKNLFDYDSEVSLAKKNYKKMISQLGLETVIVERDLEVLVPKVRSVSLAGNYGKEMLRLSMSVKLPQKAVSVTGGKIETAITGSGENVLGKDTWDNKIDFPRLKKDGRDCDFKVHVLIPDEQEKNLKEVSGYLDYITATKSREIDLGMMEFKAGSKSKEPGFSVSKVGPSEWEEGSTTMSLEVNLLRGSLKSVKFYDENGEELDISRSGTSYSGSRLLNLDFRAKGQFPSKGRIVLDVYDEVKKHKIGFKALDISLGRDELSIDEATGLLIAKITNVNFPQKYGKQGNEYELPLTVKLPGPALTVSGGVVEKVITAANKSLLPEEKWGSIIHFPKLKKDKKSVEFDVRIRNPEKQKEFIKEISGTLEYFTSNGTQKVDTGLIEFKVGTKIEKIGAMINSIKANESQKDQIELQVELEQLLHQAIPSAEFYSPDGQKLSARKSGWGIWGGKHHVSFTIKGSWPPSGRIVFQVAKNLKKHKIGFKAVNIILDGNSFESQSTDDSKKFLSENSSPDPSSTFSDKESAATGVPDYTRPLNVQMQEARQKEIKKDLDGAIQLYQGVIVNTKAVARYISRAYYRIGMCYLKMDQKDKAAEYFQRVISEFPEEKDTARAKSALKRISSGRVSSKP